MNTKLNVYRPLIIQLVGLIIVAVSPLLMDPTFDYTFTEWMNVAAVAVGAFVVWNTRNFPGWQLGKVFGSTALTVIAFLVSVGSDGFSWREVVQVVVAALTSLAVGLLGNTVNDSAQPTTAHTTDGNATPGSDPRL